MRLDLRLALNSAAVVGRPLGGAVALLGNEASGMAIDFLSNTYVVRTTS